MARGFDLDVDSPEKVIKVLRAAAESFGESAEELASAWQDRSAGRPWRIIARVLEGAADQIERTAEKW